MILNRIAFCFFVGLSLVMLLGVLVLSGTLLYSLNTIRDNFNHQYILVDTKVEKMRNIMDSMNNNRAQVLLLLQHDPKGSAASLHDHEPKMHLDRIKEGKELINNEIEVLEQILNQNEQADFQKWKEARTNFAKNGIDSVVSLIGSGNYDEAGKAVVKNVVPSYRNSRLESERIFKKYSEEKTKIKLVIEDVMQKAMMASIVMFIGGMVFVFLISILVSRNISNQMNKMKDTLAQISQNHDLTLKLDEGGTLEIAQIGKSVNVFIASISGFVSSTKRMAHELNSAALNIASSTKSITRTSEVQTDRIAGTAAATEELSVSINEMSRNTEAARTVAQETRIQSEQGGKVVTKLTQGMNQVSQNMQSCETSVADLSDKSDSINKVLREILLLKLLVLVKLVVVLRWWQTK